MKKIFITGASGFIGSHLAIDLFKKGYHVIGGDKMLEPSQVLKDFRDSCVGDEIKELEERLELFTMDFSDERLYRQLDTFKDVSLIYHLASPVGVKTITNNSGETLREATKINMFVDEVCEKFNIPVVYSSSSEVHGSGTIDDESIYKIKKLEDSPRWSYAAAKVHGEFLFGTGTYPSAIIRFFNVIGKGQTTKGMVVPTFIEAALKNEPLIILEDGVRSYCDIREAIDYIVPIGIHLMLERENSPFNLGDFNIGNVYNVCYATILAEKIIQIFESNSVIEQSEDYKESNALKNRVLKMDNELLLDMEVENISLDDILYNIKGEEEEIEDAEIALEDEAEDV
jgi:UDP-glucose 4-epimerase